MGKSVFFYDAVHCINECNVRLFTVLLVLAVCVLCGPLVTGHYTGLPECQFHHAVTILTYGSKGDFLQHLRLFCLKEKPVGLLRMS